MLDQHCIAETLSHSEAVETLRVLRTQAGDTSRSAFARHVCREFGFVNSRGQPQVASCQKALRSLHSAGRIDLPAPRHGGRAGDCRPRRLGQPVPPPQAVPPAAGAVAGLKLTLVTSPQQRRTWNELVASEHPQGAVLHVGAQLRYLIESEHGLLGALGFAAAALAVAARDEWIGWDAQLRRKRLHRVLGLSRFLIRPSVRCHLLASKVLGMVRRRLPEDFLQRYGYRPALLETYCDPQQHAGTCFRAANWTCVGQTGGRGRPLEERKTFRWIRGLRDCAEVAGQLAGPRLVAVMDREADVQALFAEQRRLEGVELLVRAKHNRSLGKDVPKLFEHMRAQPVGGQLEIKVQRSSARRGTRRQSASALRAARTAQAELRWQTVELPAPARGEAALRMQLVHVWERAAPEGVEALEWFLLTTLPVASLADAEQVLEWYRLRWRIEDWHRMLKSGCKVEYLGHRTGQRIERAVTIKAVIAWRLAAMTLLGRETPELPSEVFFTQIQLRVLRHFASKRGLAAPGNLGLAVRTMAILGGYLYRAHAPPPGHQKIWEGWTRLTIMSEAYELKDYFEPPASASQAEPGS